MLLEDAEAKAWFRLLATPGLGRESMRRLLSVFGSAGAIWGASMAQLRSAIGAQAASALGAEQPRLDEWYDTARRWRDGPGVRQFITLADADYPAPLLQSADPPLALWLQGRPEALQPPSLAMVGSRQASAEGLDNARAFSAELTRKGLCIVSGLALGIDAAAHEGALGAGGLTLAVLGHGLDTVYPSQHRALAARIEAGGALLSEHAPGVAPIKQNFPLRNRIIAGLARGTLVVEAAPQSGSLITARLAAEAGREVFAVPGSIHSPQSRGCHQLIQQGAKLVQSAQDVLDELGLGPAPSAVRVGRSRSAPVAAPSRPPEVSTSQDDDLLRALGHAPVSLDTLMSRTGLDAATLQARLLELELQAQVASLPGGRYQRRSQA
jgi:DNA processing protein